MCLTDKGDFASRFERKEKNRNNFSISKSQDPDQSAELLEAAREKRRAERGERREERREKTEERPQEDARCLHMRPPEVPTEGGTAQKRVGP